MRQQSVAGEAAPLFDDTVQNPSQAENVDPAPTIMGLLGLAAPRDSQGRFLTEAFDLAALPGGGAPAGAAPRLKAKRRCGRLRIRITGSKLPVDLTVGGRRVLDDSRRRRVRVKVKRRGRVKVTVRTRAASGVTGPARKRVVRTRCR